MADHMPRITSLEPVRQDLSQLCFGLRASNLHPMCGTLGARVAILPLLLFLPSLNRGDQFRIELAK